MRQEKRFLQRGELLFDRGDPPTGMFILVKGSIEIYLENERAKLSMALLRAFRIYYKTTDPPMCEIGNHHYRVIDLSEAGIRLEAVVADEYVLDENLQGSIAFPDGRGQEKFMGHVVRITKHDFAIMFEPSDFFPLQRIMFEQRLLIRKSSL